MAKIKVQIIFQKHPRSVTSNYFLADSSEQVVKIRTSVL
jgi:hypothetical protein